MTHHINPLRPSGQPAPQPTNGAASVLDLDSDRRLLAKAVQFTRVSYFTADERDRLSLLVVKVTGYRIEGGL